MKKKNRVGEKNLTNEGYEIEIIEYFGKANCVIQFEDGNIMHNIEYGNIIKGTVKNPFNPSVFGIGYLGVGKYRAKDNSRITREYTSWHNMLKRCYYDSSLSYKDCSVDERWHNFQVFAEWHTNNYIEGFELDKDILIKGNKIYSPETCCFVPQEINKLLIRCDRTKKSLPMGVKKYYKEFQSRLNINGEYIHLGTFKTPEKAFKAYKKVKEKHIKEVAKLCRNIISERTYQSLITYQIEITD